MDADYQECAHANCHGRVLPHKRGGRPRLFCSDSCRSAEGRSRRKQAKALRNAQPLPNVPFIPDVPPDANSSSSAAKGKVIVVRDADGLKIRCYYADSPASSAKE